MTRLQRCPSCGCTARLYVDFSKRVNSRYPIVVRCSMCGLSTEPCNSEQNAIDTWNSMFECRHVIGRQLKLF
nr:MAG TPA: restriction alleviation protein [Caudoviricetes sp.]